MNTIGELTNVAADRATQSFVGTLSSTWRRPWLTGIEVAWRWSFGAPALVLILYKCLVVVRAATAGTYDPSRLGLDKVLLADPIGALSADPLGAAEKFATAFSLIAPGVKHFAVWLVPLLLLGWVVQSSIGRTLVLHRVAPIMVTRVGTVMGLQLIRLVILCGVLWVWFQCVAWSSRFAILEPIRAKDEPNLVLYCALVIVISLAMFTAWSLVNWVLQISPLIAMVRNLGVLASLKAALGLGRVRGRLAEINLVLGIVKIALLVLAMVFSACPLPFETVETQAFLAWWWVGVGIIYLIASDFFHVARLVGYLALWGVDDQVSEAK